MKLRTWRRVCREQAYEEGPIERSCHWWRGLGLGRRANTRPLWGYPVRGRRGGGPCRFNVKRTSELTHCDLYHYNRKELIMIQMRRTLARLVLVLPLLWGVTQAAAKNGAQPVGRIAMEGTSIAAGVGVNWGDGTLRFQGRTISFLSPVLV